jgi:hypothetical protein
MPGELDAYAYAVPRSDEGYKPRKMQCKIVGKASARQPVQLSHIQYDRRILHSYLG